MGFGLAAVGGAALGAFPVGLLLVIPTLALGFLVGEAVAAIAGRPGGAFLALIGLFCGLSGQLLGHAVLGGVVVERAASALGLTYSTPPLTSFGLLLLVCGALIAAFRAASSR
ncbi:MAG: hypothetical protein HY534_00105 [Chloroflexi bacterium]|nr:hypothetical protein [Chloroflexota bacterium]